MNNLNKYIDHTILGADASEKSIIQLCKEAIEYNFMSVCINPCYILLAKELLLNSNVLVCTVIGFPLGQMTTESKVFETEDAIRKGADEIDMVINISKFKNKEYEYCLNEINLIKKACGSKVLKVIVETCLLTKEEIKWVCELILKSDSDFIKTSTGFSKSGAMLDDIILWKSILKGNKKIKAAGGIRTHQDFIDFIKAGSDRIGTSGGIKLIKKEELNSSY